MVMVIGDDFFWERISHQLQTKAMAVCWGVVHSIVALIVPDPWIGIISQ